MENLLPEYKLGMDLYGHRAISVGVSDKTETVYYDENGNEVSSDTKGATKKEVPVNSEELLIKDNYFKTKELIENRFENLNTSEYIIRMNENNGDLTIYLPEDDMTDTTSQFIYSRGQFTVEDENGQVLMDNSNLKNVKVGYSTNTTGTSVYLSIEFTKEGKAKLEQISKDVSDIKDRYL